MRIALKRIIAHGKFIPEVDGLRFIAITSVVLFHLNEYLGVMDHHAYLASFEWGWLRKILSHGHIGVPLFFVISGFILGKPFAKHFLKAGPEISIKKYFLRRLTRLEPPYLVALGYFLFAAVWWSGAVPVEDGLLSFLASATYTHNFFEGEGFPALLNGVTWSLEVEVQFYILAPLVAGVFNIRNRVMRRGLLIAATLFFLVADFYDPFTFKSILNYADFFLLGFLLADLYVSESRIFRVSRLDPVFSILLLIPLWAYDYEDFSETYGQILGEIMQLTSIFLLYYLILFHKSLKVMAQPLVTNIGGMCYSIYLMHYSVMGALGYHLLQVQFSDHAFVNTAIYVAVLMSAVMLISVLFYVGIERPCMDPNWMRKLARRQPF
ncbi:MAG: acyltransferase [Bacteroidia bacterium]|nr:acyltransferase [Bacteroidia bacterium]